MNRYIMGLRKAKLSTNTSKSVKKNMTRTITFLLATFFAVSSFGQTFEGKIV